MIRSLFGITHEPFARHRHDLMKHQKEIFDCIKIHAQQGGFCVIVGDSGVGKSVIRESIEQLGESPEVLVASLSRTMHTHLNVLKQLAESLRIEVCVRDLEKDLIQAAFDGVRERKTLYTVIDEAHLLNMEVLRKLRLLFDRFPKRHNLILFGERSLMHYLSMSNYEDIKNRVTYSATLPGLTDDDLGSYIVDELSRVGLGANTFDQSAQDLIVRSVQGNLRLCRNLAYGSLLEACRWGKKTVTISHVNAVLIQPHWRSHEELLHQQVGS